MTADLGVAVGVFLTSAVAVIFFGIRLAVYGDALATLTGWGRLFVGSVLVALATSLPELSTEISAVRLNPPNPDLAVGNLLGSTMLNACNVAVVALVFGGRRFLRQVSPRQAYLILLAVLLTGLAMLFGALKMDVAFWQVGLSSLILLLVYIAGMRMVYVTRPKDGPKQEDEGPGMTLQRASVSFLMVSIGVVIAGYFLAWSTDQIAEITGVASSSLGILAVSIVTTMPELSSALAAARIGAADLGVAGIYGSNTIHLTILFYADLFYRDGILVNQMEPAHFIAGGVAIGIMLVGMALILMRNRLRQAVATAFLVVSVLAYVAGVVTALAVAEGKDSGKEAASAQLHIPRQAAR